MGMIIPSFFGYYNAYKGMVATQAALNTINHNIANVNTPGYSRQRVDQQSGGGYTPASLSNNNRYGQLGHGVEVTDVTRTHDNFLDGQIRLQNSVYQYQNVVHGTLQQIEGILGAPSNSGLDTAMRDFFAAAQALSTHPDDMAYRHSFIQSAQNMLSLFQEQADQLLDLRTNLVGDPLVSGSVATSQAALTVAEINTKLASVADLNKQIITVTATGASPNDLLDRRDQLLSELSKQVNITVDYKSSNNVDVRIGSNLMVQGGTVNDTLSAVANPSASPGPDNDPTWITLTSNTAASINSTITGGSLGGILQAGGNASGETTIRSVMGVIDTLFGQIATNLNALQAAGRDYNGAVPTSPNDAIFSLAAGSTLSIFRYSINSNLVTDPKLIAAASNSGGVFAGVGDGRNAISMAALASTNIAGLGNTTMYEYFNNQVSTLGTNTKAAGDAKNNAEGVIKQLDQRRQSIQGVSMEEEMMDLLRYQRSFEASAKVLTTLDHVIDTIINRMI